MPADVVEIWVEAVACNDEHVCIAEGFDAEHEHVTFTPAPAMVDVLSEALTTARGPVLTAVPESMLLSRGRPVFEADAMAVPRSIGPDGHWFG